MFSLSLIILDIRGIGEIVGASNVEPSSARGSDDEGASQPMKASPLTDAELDRLGDTLSRFRKPTAMNLEQLDGFFTALICSPDTVMPSEYLHEIWGGEMADEEAFADQQVLQEILDLVMRHWNSIAQMLQSGKTFLPVLLKDEDGIAHANDWPEGFMRGVALRNEDWLELFDDEERGGSLVPILALAHEHDPDPDLRPYAEPVDADRREKLIVGVAAGVPAIYRYFEPHRRQAARSDKESATYRRVTPKLGRNDPCSCGSGKKYKQCCGKVTLH